MVMGELPGPGIFFVVFKFINLNITNCYFLEVYSFNIIKIRFLKVCSIDLQKNDFLKV